MVWAQYRQVGIGEVRVTDLDMNISVDYSPDEGTSFDVEVWNFAQSTWDKISEGDRVRIVLGWEDGVQKSICDGVVKKRNKEVDGADIKYRVKGKDKTEEVMKFSFTRSWTDKSPNRIASDIAGMVGLSTGEVESVGANISGEWTMQKDRPAKYWMDQLVNEAQDLDGGAWEWFVDTGQLFFVRKDNRKEDAVVLSFDNTLVSIGPGGSGDDTDEETLEFEAMCEPRIRDGAAVVVDTEEYEGAYKVTEYSFVSDSSDGTHEVRGTLSPLNVEYNVGYI